MNKVQLIGNVGADPVIRCFDNGNEVAKMRVVTSKRYTKDGQKVELSEWHNVEAWGKPAAIIDEYVRKGDKLYIEGELHYEEYTGKDGVSRTMAVVRLQQLELLSPKLKSEPTATPEPQAQTEAEAQPTPTATPEPPQIPLPPIAGADDLPF